MAPVTLVWTPGAVRDLEQIHAYIAADTPRCADVVAAHIVQAFERLQDFPHSGRTVPELGREDVRELIQGAYRLGLEPAEIDAELPLTDDQKAELDRRLADLDQNPEAGVPWEEARAQIEAGLNERGRGRRGA